MLQNSQNDQVIENCLSQLKAYRDQLQHYLMQRASLGKSYEPPGVAAGIRDCNSEIRRLKANLYQLGYSVPHEPNDPDEDPILGSVVYTQDRPNFVELRTLVAQRRPIVFLVGSAIAALEGLPTWDEIGEQLITKLRDRPVPVDTEQARRRETQLESLERNKNFWLRFEQTKHEHSGLLRSLIGASVTNDIPKVFSSIWQIDATIGIIDLSPYRLSSRAFSMHRGEKPVEIFTSWMVKEHGMLLERGRPFIYHPHGIEDQSDNWVVTIERIRDLTDQEEFRSFIEYIFSETYVVLVGITAGEVMDHGLLQRLTRHIDFRKHFWIKDRSELTTDQWSNSTGIRTIRYINPAGRQDALLTLIDQLQMYRLEEQLQIEPITPPSLPIDDGVHVHSAELISPADLASRDPEEIRQALNSYAQQILDGGGPEAITNYEAFQKQYSRAVYVSWYIDENEPNYTFFGYRIQRFVTEGAFGRVYEARDPDNNSVAIKLLRNEVSKKTNLLHSFRRGVRAMSILSLRNVTGMVNYQKAFEIPACVVMRWVEGRNLRAAVESKDEPIRQWADILKIGVQLSDIIRRAHAVPEQVLHRDLRPENIMLEEDWSEGEPTWKVVVLDFDLSWFIGSRQESTRHEAKTGYLAPEQVVERRGVSTRDPLVDSYGLGMTLYYMLSGKDPEPFNHLRDDWEKAVLIAARTVPKSRWLSMPNRVARLVLSATRDVQRERIDMTRIHRELERLGEVHENSAMVRNVDLDLIAEEVAARCDYFVDYEWDEAWKTARVHRAENSDVRLVSDDRQRILQLQLRRLKAAHDPRARTAADHRQVVDAICQQLSSAGWTIDRRESDAQHLSITAIIDVDRANAHLDRTASDLDKALRIFQR